MRIHRNLHAARNGKPQWVETLKGRVQNYHESLQLTNVTTRIQPAGLRKCAELGKRSVCAFFDGELVEGFEFEIDDKWQRVVFDPRRDKTFLTEDGRRWNYAVAAACQPNGQCYVLSPTIRTGRLKCL